ncbi:MAG TPA: alpha/beta fold hydrolase, partial [Gemmatimonadales bacterium]|nr:alpha/beta fold hydrolase [Gemmatimonadales bacterium]
MLAVLLLTQALVFEPVDIEVRDGMRVLAEQGTLVVPLRHAEPNGAVIRLRVVRFAAHPGASGPPLLYLSGGPGDSGVGDLQAFPAPLLDSLRANGDVLALDQRGTGLSEPRVPACPAGPALPLDRPGNPALDLPLFQRHASACVAHWKRQGIDLRAFTTDENADDVEALRRARGGGPIALLAGSYGSHLAFAVVRRHPGSVARIALFGIEGP